MAILLVDMSIRRSRHRIPALLGIFLLLFSGVREAYGIGICPMMHAGAGHAMAASHEGGGEGAALLPVEVEVGEIVEGSAEGGGHAHHGQHTPATASSVVEEASGEDTGAVAPLDLADHSSDSGHEGTACECRLLCLSISVPTPPEPVVLGFDPFVPLAPVVKLGAEDPGLLPILHSPYLLPFANAPPAHS